MTIALDILSDPICPWCYIGKTRLERALAERASRPFDITWRPFQLNPDMPREGMERDVYLERKFGGAAGAERIYSAIKQAAEADGLDVRFDLIKRTPNTLDAHRLIRWADSLKAQDAVVNALFDRYFHQGQDIGDHDVLIDVAVAAGLEERVVAALLASDTDLEAVRGEDETARRAGVSAVPTFLVARRHVVPGAQDVDLWLRVIDELSAEAASSEQASSDGAAQGGPMH